jgi:hypothetical protein
MKKTANQQIYEILKGSWIFNRTLSLKKKSPGMIDSEIITGEASFEEIKPGILNYKEQGKWLTQNERPVTREYQYCYNQAEDTVSVYFLKGDVRSQLFHNIKVDVADAKRCTIEASGEHQCAADNYKARYLFTGNEKFTLFYYVNGPNKDYASETTFKRVAEFSLPRTSLK